MNWKVVTVNLVSIRKAVLTQQHGLNLSLLFIQLAVCKWCNQERYDKRAE